MGEDEKFFTESNALKYIEGKKNKTFVGLDKLRNYLDFINRPDEFMEFIHIAGTNGKGSTSTYLASILAMSDKKVGLFTSPYFESFGERIRIIDGSEACLNWKNNKKEGEINTKNLSDILNYIHKTSAELADFSIDDLSHFELLVCIALIHFALSSVDVVVFETGLGGRLDATNVIRRAELTIFTSISYDHCDRLGNTIAEICAEKLAICKSGTKIVAYDPNDSLISEEDAETELNLIRAKAKELKIPLRLVSSTDINCVSKGPDGQKFKLKFYPNQLHTSAIADYQLQNIALAVAAALAYDDNLNNQRANLSEDPVVRALAIVKMYGRFEKLNTEAEVIIDAAHNPQAISSLLNSISTTYRNRPIYFWYSSLADKDYRRMLSLIINDKRLNLLKLVLSEIDYPRACKLEELFKVANEIKDESNFYKADSCESKLSSIDKNSTHLTDEDSKLPKSLDANKQKDDMDSIFRILDIDSEDALRSDVAKVGESNTLEIESIHIDSENEVNELLLEVKSKRAILIVSGSFYLISEFKRRYDI